MTLAFLTALFAVAIRFFVNPESALVGMTIICYSWIAVRIFEEGLVGIIWLLFRHLIDKSQGGTRNDDEQDKM